jgi:hypothetical protein
VTAAAAAAQALTVWAETADLGGIPADHLCGVIASPGDDAPFQVWTGPLLQPIVTRAMTQLHGTRVEWVALVTPLPIVPPPATWRDIAEVGGRVAVTSSDEHGAVTLSAPLLAGQTAVYVSRADWKHYHHP